MVKMNKLDKKQARSSSSLAYYLNAYIILPLLLWTVALKAFKLKKK